MQLLYILQGEYASQHNDFGKVVEVINSTFSKIGYDHFNLEDDVFRDFLQRKLEQWQ